MKYTSRQEIIFEILFVTIILSLIFSCSSIQAAKVTPHFEFVGGLIDDQALLVSAGRELQPFKVVRAIAGATFEIDQNWSGQCELVLIGDEVYRDDGDSTRVDYYKNGGSDLLYYGDYPVRNCFMSYSQRYGTFSIGRQVNAYGISLGSNTYLHRYDAPHAVYLDKEILNGVSYNYGILTAALLSGRGRPDSDYNFYLDGQTDPNIKDNNTPIVELQLDYRGFYVGYHRNKTGSAPGTIYNGKYNDNRMAAGFSRKFGEIIASGQYSVYQIGLTESGDQGQYQGTKDIKKAGYFGTLNYKGAQYTYERLDRIDSKVYYTYGETDSQEVSHIYSYNYKSMQVFYRTIENHYEELSNIGDHETYKFGILFHKEF